MTQYIIESDYIDIMKNIGIIRNLKKTRAFKSLFECRNNFILSRNLRDKKYMVIEHPKCGRTWLLQIIKYICEHERNESFINIIGRTHDGAGLQSPQLHYSELINRIPSRPIRNKKIILIMRDPKDTMVSFYFQATKRRKVYKGTISDFIRSPDYGIQKFITFYEEYLKFLDSKKIGIDYIIIDYEDMYKNCHDEIVKTITFLNLYPSKIDCRRAFNQVINDAIEYCSFEKMQRRERENATTNRTNNYGSMLPGDPNDPESFKVRKGIVGGYKDYLSLGDIKFINGCLDKSKILSKLYK